MIRAGQGGGVNSGPKFGTPCETSHTIRIRRLCALMNARRACASRRKVEMTPSDCCAASSRTVLRVCCQSTATNPATVGCRGRLLRWRCRARAIGMPTLPDHPGGGEAGNAARLLDLARDVARLDDRGRHGSIVGTAWPPRLGRAGGAIAWANCCRSTVRSTPGSRRAARCAPCRRSWTMRRAG
jgi:hypothetical protein